jgi:hypothetical protein
MHWDEQTRIQSRCRSVALFALTLSSLTAGAQQSGIVRCQPFKTSNNCYRWYRPGNPVRGLIVLLPYFGTDANAFPTAALPELMAKNNVATIAVRGAGYLNDDEVFTLRGIN